jgi:hypothetical protein
MMPQIRNVLSHSHTCCNSSVASVSDDRHPPSRITHACRAHLRMISRACIVRSVKLFSSKICKPNKPAGGIEFVLDAIKLIVTSGLVTPAARYTYDPFNRRLIKEQYRDAQGNLLATPKRTTYFYTDEGLIAESERAIQVATDGSISAGQSPQMPQITTQYIPQPGGLFTIGYLAIKTKSLSGQYVEGNPTAFTDPMGLDP